MPNFTIVCHWEDVGNGEGVPTMDADEMMVFADSEALAIRAATGSWLSRFAEIWPSCRLVDVKAVSCSLRK